MILYYILPVHRLPSENEKQNVNTILAFNQIAKLNNFYRVKAHYYLCFIFHFHYDFTI